MFDVWVCICLHFMSKLPQDFNWRNFGGRNFIGRKFMKFFIFFWNEIRQIIYKRNFSWRDIFSQKFFPKL